MNHFLQSLSERSFESVVQIQPRLASRFEEPHVASGFPLEKRDEAFEPVSLQETEMGFNQPSQRFPEPFAAIIEPLRPRAPASATERDLEHWHQIDGHSMLGQIEPPLEAVSPRDVFAKRTVAFTPENLSAEQSETVHASAPMQNESKPQVVPASVQPAPVQNVPNQSVPVATKAIPETRLLIEHIDNIVQPSLEQAKTSNLKPQNTHQASTRGSVRASNSNQLQIVPQSAVESDKALPLPQQSRNPHPNRVATEREPLEPTVQSEQARAITPRIVPKLVPAAGVFSGRQTTAQPRIEPRIAPVIPTSSPEPSRTVRVTIGRLEVRVQNPSKVAAPAPKPRPTAKVMSLEDYLVSRNRRA